MNPLLQYWYVHVPNIVLSGLAYAVAARLVLSYLLPATYNNMFWDLLRRLTDPVLHIVKWITPRAVPVSVQMIFAALWLVALRVGLFIYLGQAGLMPPVGGN